MKEKSRFIHEKCDMNNINYEGAFWFVVVHFLVQEMEFQQ
jgi:hypothetical protein